MENNKVGCAWHIQVQTMDSYYNICDPASH